MWFIPKNKLANVLQSNIMGTPFLQEKNNKTIINIQEDLSYPQENFDENNYPYNN